MSLSFFLEDVDGNTLAAYNITHNLTKMAEAVGIYKTLWHPEELGITKANECIPSLQEGLMELVCHRKTYEAYNSPNGWGMYEHFVPFVTQVLTACCDYPEATIHISM